MSQVRARIWRRVQADPGIHFNELVRELDLATGQAQYHLRHLRRTDELTAVHLYGRTHYYPSCFDAWERRAVALLRRETSRAVVVTLADGGSARPNALTAELDIARSTLEWHLSNLAEAGLVTKLYDDHGHVTVQLSNTERVARLVSTAGRTLSDRLVDRFARLVDDPGPR